MRINKKNNFDTKLVSFIKDQNVQPFGNYKLVFTKLKKINTKQLSYLHTVANYLKITQLIQIILLNISQVIVLEQYFNIE